MAASTTSSRRREVTDTGLIPDRVRGAGDERPEEATLEHELLALTERIERSGAAPCLVCGAEAGLHHRCPGCGSILD